MYNEILQSIEGIAIYPMFSLVVFVLFFICLAFWTFKADKNYMKEMSEIPLEK